MFYANNSEFKQAMPDEQQLAAACTALIQNSIVLWNYLYLSEVLVNCTQQSERNEIVTLIKNGSVMAWAHVNLGYQLNAGIIAQKYHPCTPHV